MFAAVRGGAGPTVLLMRGPGPLRSAGLMLIRADSPVPGTRPERYLPSGAGLESNSAEFSSGLADAGRVERGACR